MTYCLLAGRMNRVYLTVQTKLKCTKQTKLSVLLNLGLVLLNLGLVLLNLGLVSLGMNPPSGCSSFPSFIGGST